MIYAERADEVFATITELLDTLDAPIVYRVLFDRALASVRERADMSATFLPIDMPTAVAETLERPYLEQRVAAAACTLLWSGSDLIDDAADGELDPGWHDTSRSRLSLVSANLLATLPHLVAARLFDNGVAPASLANFSQRISITLWDMSRGQFSDLDSARAVRNVADYELLIQQKSGAEIGLFAAMPAVLAGLPEDQVVGWEEFGAVYGCMAQLFTDIESAFSDSPANDLIMGKRTLPVLHTLGLLEGSELEAFRHDLDVAASGDARAVTRAVQRMTEHGVARFCLSRVELLRHRATNCLPVKLAELLIDHPLRDVLRQFSIV